MSYRIGIRPSAERDFWKLDKAVRDGHHQIASSDISDRIHDDDIYLAVPLQKGQISCRELIGGEPLTREVKAHGPIHVEMFDTPYAHYPDLRRGIEERGIDPPGTPQIRSVK